MWKKVRQRISKEACRLAKYSVGRSVPISYHEPKLPESLMKPTENRENEKNSSN